MRNIFKLIGYDMRHLSKCFLALVVVIAIQFIPALYAWFNIYANWDPYGNTGNITFAVASEDKGYTTDEGKYINKGDELLEQLSAKTNIHFLVYDDVITALEDAEAGKCYGAIIVNKDFSANMYDFMSAIKHPKTSITFYQNFKLNPIVNKIGETAAGNVQLSVQEAYLKVLFETFFSGVSDTTDKIDLQHAAGTLIESLRSMQTSSQEMISQLEKLRGLCIFSAVKLNAVDTGAITAPLIYANSTLYSSGELIIESVNDINSYFEDLYEFIRQIASGDQDSGILPSQEELLARVQELRELADMIEETNPDGSARLRDLADSLEQAIFSNETPSISIQQLEDLEQILVDIHDSIFTLLDGTGNLLIFLSYIADNASRVTTDIEITAHSGADTLDSLAEALEYAISALSSLKDSIDNLIAKIQAVSDSELLNMLTTMSEGKSSDFAEFLACPVTMTTEVVFPVNSYGTAMAPFYSTLAIWVGCVVLAAVIKVEAEPHDFIGVTENQLFWSRYLIFLIMNELQTVIIIAGDLYLLGVQCVSPGYLYLSAAVTSFVFVTFIYSMVLAFGDIGKAVVVVMMVLQIAGSGGTYPIEILVASFEKLYLIFPFPYAINAMREAICGLYGNSIWIYYAYLSLFAVLGFLIGLSIRKPFLRVTAFVEHEMHKTGVF